METIYRDHIKTELICLKINLSKIESWIIYLVIEFNQLNSWIQKKECKIYILTIWTRWETEIITTNMIISTNRKAIIKGEMIVMHNKTIITMVLSIKILSPINIYISSNINSSSLIKIIIIILFSNKFTTRRKILPILQIIIMLTTIMR